MEKKIKLYAISTCGWCRKTRQLLDANCVPYDVTDVDLLTGEDKERVREEVRKLNPRVSYPTLIVDDEVVVGFDEERIRAALGL